MAKRENKSKKRYYPLRDAENPYKVSLVEITETQYRALYPERVLRFPLPKIRR